MVDFVFLAILLVLLLLAVLQVAVYFYARNVVAASVADGARYAASAGVDPGAGGVRALQLIGAGLDGADAASISCIGAPGRDAGSGLDVETVRCTGHVRVLFTPLRFPMRIDVSSSVLKERLP